MLLSGSLNTLKKMTNLFKLIENIDVKSVLLKDLKDTFYANKEPARVQIAKLIKIVDSLDNRNNIVLGFLLNGLLFWDWNHMLIIDKWKSRHIDNYVKWQDALSYFDALSSFANFAYNNVDFIFPEISSGEFIFEAENMGHPLISEKERICNNFIIGESPRYAIVTGANMAGKSTFLRTVAVNLILAGCGAPVCADKFIFTPLPVYTSMRAEDSLLKHESYFFAELKRLQNITKELDKGNKLFIILDEILRGTNSEDKRKGSIGFIKKITLKKAYGLVATHDLELAKLTETQPDIFTALCFEVKIENNKLDFNYKLQKGITQNMNASFLMKQMNIID
jgi:DNA mismatch repair ATPase MutS